MRLSKVLLILALAAVAVAVGLFTFVRGHGFSARSKPPALETYVARHVRNFAVPGEISESKNPLGATELSIAEGRDHFADHCAVCHANDGSGHTEMGRNLYPPAPDMRAGATQDLTDGELFYMIRNGIPLTGMPGWGGENEENWKLVLFIRHLPKIQAVELEFMDEINHLGTPKN